MIKTELEALRLQKRIDSLFSDAIGISPVNVSGTKDGDLRIRFHEAKLIVLNTPNFSVGNMAFIGEYTDFVKIKNAIEETATNYSAEIKELLDSYLEVEIEELLKRHNYDLESDE